MPFIMSEAKPAAKILVTLFSLGLGALGGLVDGSIVDYFANRTAKKYSKHYLYING